MLTTLECLLINCGFRKTPQDKLPKPFMGDPALLYMTDASRRQGEPHYIDWAQVRRRTGIPPMKKGKPHLTLVRAS